MPKITSQDIAGAVKTAFGVESKRQARRQASVPDAPLEGKVTGRRKAPSAVQRALHANRRRARRAAGETR